MEPHDTSGVLQRKTTVGNFFAKDPSVDDDDSCMYFATLQFVCITLTSSSLSFESQDEDSTRSSMRSITQGTTLLVTFEIRNLQELSFWPTCLERC